MGKKETKDKKPGQFKYFNIYTFIERSMNC